MNRVERNAVLDLTALGALACVVFTGLMLRFPLPPGSGRGAGPPLGDPILQRRPPKTVFGLDRGQWGDLHLACSLGLLTILALHLFLHRRWIAVLFRGPKGNGLSWRTALSLAAILVMLVMALAPLLLSPDTPQAVGELHFV